MRKKIGSVIIVFIIVSFLATVFATWCKLTHRSYADALLTTSVFLSAITITSLILFMAISKKREPGF